MVASSAARSPNLASLGANLLGALGDAGLQRFRLAAGLFALTGDDESPGA
jgi:hypothetical protein